MRRIKVWRSILIFVTVAVQLVLVVGCSSGGSKSQGSSRSSKEASVSQRQGQSLEQFVRTDTGPGGVTVTVIWASPEYVEAKGQEVPVSKSELRDNVVFIVSMTTHSGDLSAYDVSKNAVLRDSSGNRYTASSVSAVSEDSHHPVWKLKFPPKVLTSQSQFFEFVLLDLGGVKERTYRFSP